MGYDFDKEYQGTKKKMERMMKIRLIVTISAAIAAVMTVVIVWSLMCDRIGEGLENQEQEYKSYVGSMVVIQSDTLQVVDFSTWDETFILSDGKEVGYDFVKYQTLKK